MEITQLTKVRRETSSVEEGIYYEMDESSAGEPDADKCGDELTEADAVGRLEYIEILQNVRNRHQTQCSREP